LKDEYNTTQDNVRDHVDKKLTGETAPSWRGSPSSTRPRLRTAGNVQHQGAGARRRNRPHRHYLTKSRDSNLSKETKRIPISSVVLTGQRIALADALFNIKDKGGPSVNPLIQDGMQVIPA